MQAATAEHLDALLASGLGPFAASFTLGTLAGVAARLAAPRLQEAMTRRRRRMRRAGAVGAGAAVSPTGGGLPPRPPSRPKPLGGDTPSLTRAFATGAVQTTAFSFLRAGAQRRTE